MKTLLPLFVLLVLSSPAHVLAQAVEEEAVDEVSEILLNVQQLSQKKATLDEAEQAFEAALKERPDNVRIASLRRTLAFANSRAKRHQVAVSHASAYLDDCLKQFGQDVKQVDRLPRAVESLLFIFKKAQQQELASEKLDTAIAAVQAQIKSKPTVELADALSQLQGAKVLRLAELEKSEQATALLKQELNDARRSFNLDRDDPAAALALANLLSTQADLFETTAPDKEPAARREFREFAAARVKQHSGSAEFVRLYLEAQLGAFYEIVQSDVEAAQKIRAGLKDYLAHFSEAHPDLEGLATRGEQLLEGMKRQIASSKAHLEMVGKPATELDVAAWVNGSSLSDKDLEGKVVLLDFWAMWCGPCIATFPHLRQWHEKYANKGLVIVGMTKYYEYDWDEAGQGIEKIEGLEPENEQAALVKFAAHHKLKHPFAVMPEESDFSESYGVQGIPQVVLIDRAGKVRMIRVGSGSRNAHDLEEAIKRALAAAP